MNLEDDILIENFLRNELSDEERTSFLERIKSDSEFKKQYLLEKQLFESLNEEDWSFVNTIDSKETDEYEALFKSQEIQNLKQVIKNASTNSKGDRGKVIRLLTGIAAAVVIGVFALRPILSPSVLDTNTLYTTYADLNKLPSFAERSSGDINENLVIAEKLFKEKNYEKAASTFDDILDSDKSVSGAYIYAALAQSQLGNFDKAIEVLNELESSDLIDSEKAYWYKSLVYIKANKVEQAKKELKNIIEKSLFNTSKAEELLGKL
ncbi:tetratricopeptide repeat protein [Tenacibaculum sp. 190524A05c]|uniref:Tetratricopeptide repeat protein n=1 Tax=Tenacibaculum platacis TaxID=3137852 RepID=A0ABM9P4V0_9FLAO